MSKPDMVEIIDFVTWFAVTRKNSTSAGSGFDCGEDLAGCDGARIMLCGRHLSGDKAVAAWWYFEDCFYSYQKDNMDSANMTMHAATCARPAGISVQALSNCVDGPDGQAMLEASANMTLSPPAVVWTPWFELDGKVPGGGKQPIEIDYLKVICDAYTGTPPESCNGA